MIGQMIQKASSIHFHNASLLCNHEMGNGLLQKLGTGRIELGPSQKVTWLDLTSQATFSGK